MVEGFRPLQQLILCEWVQENINLPIDLQRRVHDCASRSREQPPPPHYFPPGFAFPLIRATVYQPAALEQPSATGALPLHIAVALHDIRIVEVLLAAGADRGPKNARGETAGELAERLISEGVKWRCFGEDPRSAICRLLADPSDLELSTLREKYAEELVRVIQSSETENPSDRPRQSTSQKSRTNSKRCGMQFQIW
jgi:hypothetical protein